jgi:ABC-type dipeptide/oligopeptide/nickel transport system permease component
MCIGAVAGVIANRLTQSMAGVRSPLQYNDWTDIIVGCFRLLEGIGLLLMYLFALKLGWLPSFGYGDGGLKYLILPAVTLGVSPMALLARTTRAAVLEIMTADFVRTARSKGMSETLVMKWHVMRNALVLILTTIGLQFGALMGQAVVVEKLFSWPGIGSLLVDSVLQRDIPAVQGSILVVVLFFLTINTLVDVLYAVIDPRIRYA